MDSLFCSSLQNKLRRAFCASLASLLIVGCAGQTQSTQTANDTKTATQAGTSTSVQSEPSETNGSNKTARYAGWAVIAVGAQSAVLAVATSFIMLHEDSVRSDECNAQKVCSTAGLQANSKLGEQGAFNAGAWIVAAAGIGIGAYLVLTNPPSSDGATSSPATKDTSTKPPPKSPSPSAAVGVGPNGSGMGLNFRSEF